MNPSVTLLVLCGQNEHVSTQERKGQREDLLYVLLNEVRGSKAAKNNLRAVMKSLFRAEVNYQRLTDIGEAAEKLLGGTAIQPAKMSPGQLV